MNNFKVGDKVFVIPHSYGPKKFVGAIETNQSIKGSQMELWCCACAVYVGARLTDGAEIYPHRPDLSVVPRWICDGCKNSVGCHHKTTNPTRPLGNIPSPELKKARSHIHTLIDPLWKSKKIKRSALYKRMSGKVGWNYHTASLRTIDEARKAYRAGLEITKELN